MREYYIVNKTKKQFIFEIHSRNTLPGDYDLWDYFIEVMQHDWKGDQIQIIADFTDDLKDYTPITIKREYKDPEWFFCNACERIVHVSDGWAGKNIGIKYCENCGNQSVQIIRNQNQVAK